MVLDVQVPGAYSITTPQDTTADDTTHSPVMQEAEGTRDAHISSGRYGVAMSQVPSPGTAFWPSSTGSCREGRTSPSNVAVEGHDPVHNGSHNGSEPSKLPDRSIN